MKKKLLLISVLMLLIMGCAFGGAATATPDINSLVETEVANQMATETANAPVVQDTAEPLPTNTSAPVLPTATQGPTLTPLPTNTPLPPAGRVGCVNERAGVVLDFDPSLNDQTVLMNALNQGISMAALNQQLNDIGRASHLMTAVQLDFNQDNYLDVAVAITEVDPVVFPPTGTIYIYFCNDRQFTYVDKIDPPEPNMGTNIYYAQNLDNLGGDELLIGLEMCGASTCFDTFEIWSWSNPGGFWNRLIGQSNDQPFPDVYLKDPNADRVYDIEVQYGAAGSIGAGPGRGLTRTWAYDNGTQTWHISGEEQRPSSFRIHMVHDADAAMTAGDNNLARDLYLHVITNDPPLDDWADPATEQANLKAYANYRMVVLYRLMGETVSSDQWLADFHADFPPGSTGSAYADMADVFVNGFDFGGIIDGCQAAALFAGGHTFEILDPLSSQTYGYGNPDYYPTNMCP